MRMELFLPSHFPGQNHTLKYIFSAFNCLKHTRKSSEMGAVKRNCTDIQMLDWTESQ